MKLLEYEAKRLIKQSGAAVPSGTIISLGDTPTINLPAVIKSQVPVGGRGKAGGVQVISEQSQLGPAIESLFELSIKGHKPRVLLAEERLDIAKELYLAYVIDRTQQSIVLMAHSQGGVDVESQTTPPLTIILKNVPDQAVTAKLTDYFELPLSLHVKLEKLLLQLWQTFIQQDAILLEINPLVITSDQQLVCADAKMELDDAAAFRHRDWHFEQKIQSSQFVILNPQGTIACMANGAGLAMATVDAIKAAGAEPANFLDIGGGTNAKGMTVAFEQIQALANVKAIVINVFAGITRCDEVATAILDAKKQFPKLPPLFIRLSGTNDLVGKQMLSEHLIATLPSLNACVEAALKELKNV